MTIKNQIYDMKRISPFACKQKSCIFGAELLSNDINIRSYEKNICSFSFAICQ